MTDRIPAVAPGARELDDLEMLLLGGYPPLRGFLGPAEISAVTTQARLTDGTPWPAPVTLVVADRTAASAAAAGDRLRLLDEEGTAVAELSVEESWRVGADLHGLAGPVRALAALERGSHRSLRQHAAGRNGAGPVLGVPLDHPLHEPQLAALRAAAGALGARIMLLPLTGHRSARGMDGPALVRACVGVATGLGADLDAEVVPVAVPRHGDERRHRLLGARVAAAYGATHVPGPLPHLPGGPVVVDLPAIAWSRPAGRWAPTTDVPADDRDPREAHDVDHAIRDHLVRGEPVPAGLTHHAALREITRTYRAGGGRGFTVLFTGLSGAGKSTVAKAVHAALLEHTDRSVTLLDGDVVRRMLSSELGFSKDDRRLNIRRIGFVAAEITRHGGIALCAPIAPYAATRAEVRSMVEEHGGFLLVHVSTPLQVCEDRDRKGLYAKARAGIITEFTGISDPYEEPTDADLVIDTAQVEPHDAVRLVTAAVTARGWLTR